MYGYHIPGEKEITRSVSFKPYSSQGSYRPDAVPELFDSDFEEQFCQYLVQEIPAIEHEKGDTLADKVERYLIDDILRFEQALVLTHKYIKTKKITHYISGIELGAAIYSVSTSKQKLRNASMDLDLGVNQAVRLGGGLSALTERKHRQNREHSIGQMDLLQDGKGEGVIGYSLQPLFKLVSDEHCQIKRVLQQATRFYLDRSRKNHFDLAASK